MNHVTGTLVCKENGLLGLFFFGGRVSKLVSKKVWIISQQCSHIAVAVLVKEVPKIHSLKETTTEM